MTRIESVGSLWELDDDLGRYRRWPKCEAPREMPEWSDERAGGLQDFVWHEMAGWEIRSARHQEWLVIRLPDDERVVTAPWPRVLAS